MVRSRGLGHVQVARTAMERLGLATLLSSQPCPERDRVLAMIALLFADLSTIVRNTCRTPGAKPGTPMFLPLHPSRNAPSSSSRTCRRNGPPRFSASS
jgi:hypothetical protein